jgi:hypothetical protein
MSKVESALHVLMGFFCGLVGLGLLLTWREFKQLPPENRKHPVCWVSSGSRSWSKAWVNNSYDPYANEYWAKARVLDTLRDGREYIIGYTAATLVHLGVITWLLTRSF